MKRKAESEIFQSKPSKGLFLEEIMQKRSENMLIGKYGKPRPKNIQINNSTDNGQIFRKKVVHSSETKQRPAWQRRRNVSSGRNEHILDPEGLQ